MNGLASIVWTVCECMQHGHFEILLETGASQTDASRFSNAKVDWNSRTFNNHSEFLQ